MMAEEAAQTANIIRFFCIRITCERTDVQTPSLISACKLSPTLTLNDSTHSFMHHSALMHVISVINPAPKTPEVPS